MNHSNDSTTLQDISASHQDQEQPQDRQATPVEAAEQVKSESDSEATLDNRSVTDHKASDSSQRDDLPTATTSSGAPKVVVTTIIEDVREQLPPSNANADGMTTNIACAESTADSPPTDPSTTAEQQQQQQDSSCPVTVAIDTDTQPSPPDLPPTTTTDSSNSGGGGQMVLTASASPPTEVASAQRLSSEPNTPRRVSLPPDLADHTKEAAAAVVASASMSPATQQQQQQQQPLSIAAGGDQTPTDQSPAPTPRSGQVRSTKEKVKTDSLRRDSGSKSVAIRFANVDDDDDDDDDDEYDDHHNNHNNNDGNYNAHSDDQTATSMAPARDESSARDFTLANTSEPIDSSELTADATDTIDETDDVDADDDVDEDTDDTSDMANADGSEAALRSSSSKSQISKKHKKEKKEKDKKDKERKEKEKKEKERKEQEKKDKERKEQEKREKKEKEKREKEARKEQEKREKKEKQERKKTTLRAKRDSIATLKKSKNSSAPSSPSLADALPPSTDAPPASPALSDTPSTPDGSDDVLFDDSQALDSPYVDKRNKSPSKRDDHKASDPIARVKKSRTAGRKSGSMLDFLANKKFSNADLAGTDQQQSKSPTTRNRSASEAFEAMFSPRQDSAPSTPTVSPLAISGIVAPANDIVSPRTTRTHSISTPRTPGGPVEEVAVERYAAAIADEEGIDLVCICAPSLMIIHYLT
jgi:hypothetical protein